MPSRWQIDDIRQEERRRSREQKTRHRHHPPPEHRAKRDAHFAVRFAVRLQLHVELLQFFGMTNPELADRAMIVL